MLRYIIPYIISVALCIAPSADLAVDRIPCADEVDETALSEVRAIAQTVWGEGRGLNEYEQSLIVWCILNRVDDERFPDDIMSVITAPSQFMGYSKHNPVDPDIYDLCIQVCTDWVMGVERPLPQQYVFFAGDGKHNYYRDSSGNMFSLTN